MNRRYVTASCTIMFYITVQGVISHYTTCITTFEKISSLAMHKCAFDDDAARIKMFLLTEYTSVVSFGAIFKFPHANHSNSTPNKQSLKLQKECAPHFLVYFLSTFIFIHFGA